MRLFALAVLSLALFQQGNPSRPTTRPTIENANAQKEASNSQSNKSDASPVPAISKDVGSLPVQTPAEQTKQPDAYNPENDCLYRAYLWATILGVCGGVIGVGVLVYQTILTRTSFVSNFRPKIVLRTATLQIPHKVRCVISNTGGTRAYVLSSNITVRDIEGKLPPDPPYDPANNGILGKAAVEPGGFIESVFTLDAGTIKQLNFDYTAKTGGSPNPGSVHLLGYVQYRDDNGIVRYTRFCRLLNVQSDRFITVDDADYDYAD